MVAPLNIARGTQNKILEAMAMGVPVVTSAVAAGGVDAVEWEPSPGRADRPTSTLRPCCTCSSIRPSGGASRGRTRTDAVPPRLGELDEAARLNYREVSCVARDTRRGPSGGLGESAFAARGKPRTRDVIECPRPAS